MRSITGSGASRPECSGEVRIDPKVTPRHITITGPRQMPRQHFTTGPRHIALRPAPPRRRPKCERSFQVDSVTAENVILVDDEWTALSLPAGRFSCRLEPGLSLIVPFEDDGTPIWSRATVSEGTRVRG